MDNRGFGQGRIISLGPDLKERWRLTSMNSPTDVLTLGNDRVMVIESNLSRITERTTAGTILNTRSLPQPLSLSALADGGTLVFCRNQVYEYDKDWNRGSLYTRATYDILGGARLPGGDVVVITSTNNAAPGANCIRLDSKLKETNKTYTFGRMQNIQWMDVAGDELVLVCEFDKVAEYDLKTGKLTWKYECINPTSCQRLLNGNTLIGLINANRAIEVDPSGEVVWEYQAKDGLRVGRAGDGKQESEVVFRKRLSAFPDRDTAAVAATASVSGANVRRCATRFASRRRGGSPRPRFRDLGVVWRLDGVGVTGTRIVGHGDG